MLINEHMFDDRAPNFKLCCDVCAGDKACKGFFTRVSGGNHWCVLFGPGNESWVGRLSREAWVIGVVSRPEYHWHASAPDCDETCSKATTIMYGKVLCVMDDGTVQCDLKHDSRNLSLPNKDCDSCMCATSLCPAYKTRECSCGSMVGWRFLVACVLPLMACLLLAAWWLARRARLARVAAVELAELNGSGRDNAGQLVEIAGADKESGRDEAGLVGDAQASPAMPTAVADNESGRDHAGLVGDAQARRDQMRSATSMARFVASGLKSLGGPLSAVGSLLGQAAQVFDMHAANDEEMMKAEMRLVSLVAALKAVGEVTASRPHAAKTIATAVEAMESSLTRVVQLMQKRSTSSVKAQAAAAKSWNARMQEALTDVEHARNDMILLLQIYNVNLSLETNNAIRRLPPRSSF